MSRPDSVLTSVEIDLLNIYRYLDDDAADFLIDFAHEMKKSAADRRAKAQCDLSGHYPKFPRHLH